MSAYKILLLEDDKNLNESICRVLGKKFDITSTKTTDEAYSNYESSKFDLLLIDISVPSDTYEDGLDFCKHVRDKDSVIPIIIISGKDSINTKVGAFKIGVDDYLCKPFNFMELNARVKALLRRVKKDTSANSLKCGSVELDCSKKVLKINKKTIELSKKEYEILNLLLSNQNKVYSRDQLLDLIWRGIEVSGNTVNVHIKHIRDKTSSHLEEPLIQTVFGVGYTISASPVVQ